MCALGTARTRRAFGPSYISFGHVGYFQGKVVAQYVVRYICGRVKHYGVTGSASAGQPWVISSF